MRKTAETLPWRYLEHGDVLHALNSASGRVALCGRMPTWFRGDWYGTGSQREYERAASLPYCRQCYRLAAGLP